MAVARATIRRGEWEGVTDFNCEQFNATECGKGFSSFNTCSSVRNEVVGSSRNSAQGPGPTDAWLGVISDSDFCEGPPGGEELQCDEAGNPVFYGGDPANCDPEDGGGGGDGSGTQYYPGDYTDGETVDWSTGIGNGGSSVCGKEAMIAYVCIDTWNEETGSWEEWGCGYATTC